LFFPLQRARLHGGKFSTTSLFALFLQLHKISRVQERSQGLVRDKLVFCMCPLVFPRLTAQVAGCSLFLRRFAAAVEAQPTPLEDLPFPSLSQSVSVKVSPRSHRTANWEFLGRTFSKSSLLFFFRVSLRVRRFVVLFLCCPGQSYFCRHSNFPPFRESPFCAYLLDGC